MTTTQALGVGIDGADSTLENALSYATLFGLSSIQAQTLVEEILEGFKLWDEHCHSCGLSDADIELTRKVRIVP